MENRIWRKCILQWIRTCSFHDEPYLSIEQTRIEDFFTAFAQHAEISTSSRQGQQQQQKHQQEKHVLHFLKKHFPDFEPNLDSDGYILTSDYSNIYSLLMIYACVIKPNKNFHKICELLPVDTQRSIAYFFEEIVDIKKLTREKLNEIINKVSNGGPQTSANTTSTTNNNNTSNNNNNSDDDKAGVNMSNLDIKGAGAFTPPTPKTALLNQCKGELIGLRAQLETERFEKQMIEQEKDQIIKSLNIENKIKKDQLAKLQRAKVDPNEEEDKVAATCQSHDNSYPNRQLLKEIANKEAIIADTIDKLHDLRTENSELNENLKSIKLKFKERIQELELTNDQLEITKDQLMQDVLMKQERIECLQRDKYDLERCVQESRDAMLNKREILDSSADLLNSSFSPNSTSSFPENLASTVIDKQLHEQKQQNIQLVEEIEKLRENHKLISINIQNLIQKHRLDDDNINVAAANSTDAVALEDGDALNVISQCIELLGMKYEEEQQAANDIKQEMTKLLKRQAEHETQLTMKAIENEKYKIQLTECNEELQALKLELKLGKQFERDFNEEKNKNAIINAEYLQLVHDLRNWKLHILNQRYSNTHTDESLKSMEELNDDELDELLNNCSSYEKNNQKNNTNNEILLMKLDEIATKLSITTDDLPHELKSSMDVPENIAIGIYKLECVNKTLTDLQQMQLQCKELCDELNQLPPPTIVNLKDVSSTLPAFIAHYKEERKKNQEQLIESFHNLHAIRDHLGAVQKRTIILEKENEQLSEWNRNMRRGIEVMANEIKQLKVERRKESMEVEEKLREKETIYMQMLEEEKVKLIEDAANAANAEKDKVLEKCQKAEREYQENYTLQLIKINSKHQEYIEKIEKDYAQLHKDYQKQEERKLEEIWEKYQKIEKELYEMKTTHVHDITNLRIEYENKNAQNVHQVREEQLQEVQQQQQQLHNIVKENTELKEKLCQIKTENDKECKKLQNDYEDIQQLLKEAQHLHKDQQQEKENKLCNLQEENTKLKQVEKKLYTVMEENTELKEELINIKKEYDQQFKKLQNDYENIQQVHKEQQQEDAKNLQNIMEENTKLKQDEKKLHSIMEENVKLKEELCELKTGDDKQFKKLQNDYENIQQLLKEQHELHEEQQQLLEKQQLEDEKKLRNLIEENTKLKQDEKKLYALMEENTKLKEDEKKLHIVMEEKTNLKEELNKIKTENEKRFKKLQNDNENIQQLLKDEQHLHKEQQQENENKLRNLQNKNTKLKQDEKKLHTVMEENTELKEELIKTKKENDQQFKKLQHDYENIQQLLKEQQQLHIGKQQKDEKKLCNLIEETTMLKHQLKSKDDEIIKLHNDVKSRDDKLIAMDKKTTSLLETMEIQYAVLEKEIINANLKLENSSKILTETQMKLSTVVHELEETKNTMELLRTQLQQKDKEVQLINENHEAQLHTMKLQITEANNKVAQLSENYTKLKCEEKQQTEMQSDLLAKRQQLEFDCQVLQAKYREAKTTLTATEQRFKEQRNEMEGKLEKMKIKMKALYNDEMSKLKEKQQRDGDKIIALTTQNYKHEEHNQKLSNQIVRLNDKLLEQQKQTAILSTKLKHMQDKDKEREKERERELKEKQLKFKQLNITTDGITFKCPNNAKITNSNSNSSSNAAVTSTAVNQIGTNLAMEDEEGEVFNNTYLTDLKLGRIPDMSAELQYRNSLQPPHLKSTYAAQYDLMGAANCLRNNDANNYNNDDDDDVKDGGTHSLDDSMLGLLTNTSSNGSHVVGPSRKKVVGGTHYSRPGLPTPSKNGGRLSFGGGGCNEPAREILRELCDENISSTKTPARFKLFTSRFSVGGGGNDVRSDENSPPKRRLSNIFKRK